MIGWRDSRRDEGVGCRMVSGECKGEEGGETERCAA